MGRNENVYREICTQPDKRYGDDTSIVMCLVRRTLSSSLQTFVKEQHIWYRSHIADPGEYFVIWTQIEMCK